MADSLPAVVLPGNRGRLLVTTVMLANYRDRLCPTARRMSMSMSMSTRCLVLSICQSVDQLQCIEQVSGYTEKECKDGRKPDDAANPPKPSRAIGGFGHTGAPTW
jgi:hypothetical protein